MYCFFLQKHKLFLFSTSWSSDFLVASLGHTMPKRTTFAVRNTISCLSQRGVSRIKIMSIVGVSRNVVDCWSVRDSLSDKSRNTLNLSNRKRGVIKRVMRQTKSLRNTGMKVGVSYSTVRKITRRSKVNRGGMYPYKEKSKLRIYPKQLNQRRVLWHTTEDE